MVIRLPQECFGSPMIFIVTVTSLLFSITMSDTADAVDAFDAVDAVDAVANSYVGRMSRKVARANVVVAVQAVALAAMKTAGKR